MKKILLDLCMIGNEKYEQSVMFVYDFGHWKIRSRTAVAKCNTHTHTLTRARTYNKLVVVFAF